MHPGSGQLSCAPLNCLLRREVDTTEQGGPGKLGVHKACACLQSTPWEKPDDCGNSHSLWPTSGPCTTTLRDVGGQQRAPWRALHPPPSLTAHQRYLPGLLDTLNASSPTMPLKSGHRRPVRSSKSTLSDGLRHPTNTLVAGGLGQPCPLLDTRGTASRAEDGGAPREEGGSREAKG